MGLSIYISDIQNINYSHPEGKEFTSYFCQLLENSATEEESVISKIAKITDLELGILKQMNYTEFFDEGFFEDFVNYKIRKHEEEYEPWNEDWIKERSRIEHSMREGFLEGKEKAFALTTELMELLPSLIQKLIKTPEIANQISYNRFDKHFKTYIKESFVEDLTTFLELIQAAKVKGVEALRYVVC